jgi:hypothetical protein
MGYKWGEGKPPKMSPKKKKKPVTRDSYRWDDPMQGSKGALKRAKQ